MAWREGRADGARETGPRGYHVSIRMEGCASRKSAREMLEEKTPPEWRVNLTSVSCEEIWKERVESSTGSSRY